ncbi:MAG: DNA primase [Deltaproteobacteria bacterium]|nr:DNA primase [Deltaproteobacteria bacterium]
MAFHIPDDKLAEIRNKADIVEVISERVMLKKSGKDYSGLCPFHAEKTPSFSVSQDKQMYYCFGCGAGGDIFSFIMKSDGMKFSEAVLFLARRYGIDIPSREMTRSQREAISKREKILALNRRVMDFYAGSLVRSPAGEIARQYLKKRGISQKIIDRFKLGFAPDGWDRLSRFIARSDVKPELAESAGLIVPRNAGRGNTDNGYYDRFRNRIIFPIIDVGGQVIGFGGRVMDDSKPKYLNSPETPVYNKSKTLYGLDIARNKCRQAAMVFIVEGYFDLLALHQHGIENTVATLGTALTAAHVRRLKGYAKKTCLVFDADTAGIKAAQRSAPIFLGESMTASVMLLPEGHDPDSFVFEHGPEPFLARAQTAEGIVKFLITRAMASHGNSIEGRVGVVADIAPVIGAMTDSVARSEYAGYLADRIGADPNAVMEKIRENSGRMASNPETYRGGYGLGPEKGSGAGQDLTGSRRIERMIIAMMIQHPASIADIVQKEILEMFTDLHLKEIGQEIVKFPPSAHGDISLLMNHLEDEDDQRLVASMAMGGAGAMGGLGAMGEMRWKEKSCNRIIEQFLAGCSKKSNDLVCRIRAAEENNDHELIRQLLTEKQAQIKRRGRF